MSIFRYGIMGAGGIANRFCKAVSLLPDCEVCAVASKSMSRAQDFANRNNIKSYYDSYEEMLKVEELDCVYIAVTPNDHYRLTMMCIERNVPVLCEKAMFCNSTEAHNVFEAARKNNVFVMEALWSRFLPAVNKVKAWLEDGKIGIPELSQFSIGFVAGGGKEGRFFNPLLGGGAAKDITVYAYEITTYLLNQQIKKINVSATWNETGVDVNNHISIEFEHTLSDLMTSFVTGMKERMVIYGRYGKIILPFPHCASECFLYDEAGNLKEHFIDTETVDGFTYEISEVMKCIREGKMESVVVPWEVTIACSELFDKIEETRVK